MAGTLVIGFVFVDIKGFALGDYNPHGRNLGTVKFLHGGVSRNVVETIANTGMPVTFASLCEDTALGNDVVKRLMNAGADISRMRYVDHNGIGTWLVVLDRNGNAEGQISCPPDTAALEALIEEEGESMVREADNIVLELDTSAVIAEKILPLAKRYGKPVYTVVGNMSVISSRRDFVAALDCFVCNEIEAGMMFGEKLEGCTPECVLSVLREKIGTLGCPSMVVTMGAMGAAYCDTRTGEAGICPAIPTKLVDSTGAGDAFLSGVVMGLSRGMKLEGAVKAGTALASLAIRTEESCIARDHTFWDRFTGEEQS